MNDVWSRERRREDKKGVKYGGEREDMEWIKIVAERESKKKYGVKEKWSRERMIEK